MSELRAADQPPRTGARADRSARQIRPTPLNTSSAAGVAGEAPPLRVGVIGLGFGAEVHIPALRHLPETEPIAVCSRRQEHAQIVAAQHVVPHVTGEFRKLINHPDVDAIIAATPPYLNHAIAIAAIEAGKPILMESPLARTFAEARDLTRMAENAGVVAMVNFEFRHILVRRRAKELIDEGFIGKPYSASMMVYRSGMNPANKRPFGWMSERSKGGGMLGFSGSHHIDALRWWFGDIKAVTGGTATLVKQRNLAESQAQATVDADDNFSVLMQFENGAMGTIHYTATSAFDWGEQIILTGSEGMLIVQGDDRLFGARHNDSTMIEMPIPGRLFDDLPPFDHYLTAPTARVIQLWVKSIRSRQVLTQGFGEGAKVQEVMDAVSRAIAQGKWVDVAGPRRPMAPHRSE